jgi:hypothetical protein
MDVQTRRDGAKLGGYACQLLFTIRYSKTPRSKKLLAKLTVDLLVKKFRFNEIRRFNYVLTRTSQPLNPTLG